MGGAVSRCGRCCVECVPGLEEDQMLDYGGLMVSVTASRSTGQSTIPGVFSNFKSRNVNHENVRDIQYAASERRGNWGCCW